ncbi:hypothetical protein GCM10023148_26200 [Actinokineospora soli]
MRPNQGNSRSMAATAADANLPDALSTAPNVSADNRRLIAPDSHTGEPRGGAGCWVAWVGPVLSCRCRWP